MSTKWGHHRDFEELFYFKESEMVGRNLDELIAGQKYIGVAISYTKESLAGKTIHGSGKRQRKDGTYIDVEFIGVPVIIEGKVIGAYGVYQDTSKRKQVEEALRESEEKYRSIIENIEEGYSEVDLAGSFTFFNDSIVKILGYSKDELMGINSRQYTDKENAKKLYETFSRVYKTGEPAKAFGWEIIRKDGTKRYVEASVSLMRDAESQPIGFRGIARDLTERELAKEALRREEEKFRVLVEKSPLGVSLIGEDGHYEYLNPTFIEMFGYTLEDIPAGRDWFIKAYPDSRYRQEVISTWIDDLEKYEPGASRPRSFKVSCKDGSEKEVYFRTVTMETGEQLVIYEDITERIRLEVHLRQAQKMEAIGTLAGGIAHEFNNALSGITGNLGLLEMDFPEDDTIREYVKHMKASAHRMAGLTKQLLAYARGGKYQPKIISLSEFTRDALPLIKHSIAPSIYLDTNLPPDISYIEADPTQFQIVLSSLLMNASEAIEGEGRVRISTRNEEVDKGLAKEQPDVKPGPYVCLTVEDDGKGMDEETRSKMFEPFFTTKFQGRGLGMAAVYGIVRNHGGRIFVDSELGKGTEIRIILPTVEAEIKEVKRPKAEVTTEPKNILVIEDEEMVMDVTRAMLEKLGHRVIGAITGKEAIDLANTFDGDIDLALLDIKLPDMEGGRIYPFIKETRPNLKVIVYSGYSIDGPAREILDAGAEGFLQKPFSMKDLSQKLGEILDKK